MRASSRKRGESDSGTGADTCVCGSESPTSWSRGSSASYRHARIDAAQHADQTALDTVACGDFPRNVIFAHLRVVEIADLATEFARLTQRGTFQPRRNILTVLGEILGPDAVEVQVRLHALGMSKTT